MDRSVAILTVAGALAKAYATDTHTSYTLVMERVVAHPDLQLSIPDASERDERPTPP